MSLATAVGLVLVGLLLLAGGGELLVRGATALARLAGVTPAVIGLTIVAIGTSLPELVVSLLAAAQHQPDIAVANVVGSNIFNIVGILGVTALIVALPVHGSAVRLEWPFMFGVSAALVVFSRDGLLDRFEGGLMLGAFTLFTWYMIRLARAEFRQAERREFETESVRRSIRGPLAAVPVALLAVAGGLALLVGGARALVDGAVELARLAGMSERVIGLTVVAIGTSMPELAASTVAAVRGRTDVAVANLIGSNIFNILGILGVTALYHPVPVAEALRNSDMVWMMVTALALFPILRSGGRVSRLEGAFLLGMYVVYLVLLIR
ncbi:MAG TPA: calcium/sodium antiporter [Gemmatimonadales bacterium]|nr:calcium/sodium antiporter [Gemmatimonadales bacterium]